ncbi:sulfite exporter TauE/SafE family protein [Aestuariicella hydrocarbonica]|uniref:Probable membrane transporter protein n=1 Tax=Pseudomaricurvus hydrocarbonicus TaxID=1470433 RepID=A0A9E5JX83_9GAMM|nr:sulfite exporter TauE/SafE family protein [Aestuariicella hydrocarbonica]NHO66595.1 sulfite exporter TauE/SafE family protein [Aestuariicella hydrocarbonica]
MLTILIVFAVVGVAAGLIAGLFGLGGGVVMVPAMIYTFGALAFPEAITVHLAVGTSLACIVVTASVAGWTHWQRGAIDWSLLKPLVPGVVLGAWLGAMVASQLAGEQLKLAFAVFLMLVALTMLRRLPSEGSALPGPVKLGVVAAAIGGFSSLFGVGGGSMTVPYLRFCGVAMARAVATSAALGLPIALSGAVSYVVQGWGEETLPEGALGFVYLPAFLGLVLCSAPASRVGAKLAHRLPAAKLQKAFAIVLLLIAAQLLVSGMMSTAQA